jgi:hypothetical protein
MPAAVTQLHSCWYHSAHLFDTPTGRGRLCVANTIESVVDTQAA